MALTDEQEKEFKLKLNDALASVKTLTDAAVVAKADNDRLNAKITEANKHTKKAEQDAADALKQKATDDGNFEQLFKSSEEARNLLVKENANMVSSNASDKVSAASLQLASVMASGENIGLLSTFLEKRLKFDSGSVKVTDEAGNLTVSSLQDLQNEFVGSAKYSSLLTGNQSSGGSANGGSNSGSAAKVMKRVDFDALAPLARSSFMKDGGTLTDAP